jgi:O-acetylhomoserine (thiol)-lyase
MDGHACALGGVVIDGGKFDWTNGKFPMFTTPDESYHGIVYAEHFGNAAYITKMRTHLMRDMGAMASPQNAFLLNLGLETLALRMERHCSNASKIAEYLQNEAEKPDGKISWVNFPELPSNANNALCKKYMPHGSSGVISFGIKGGREKATKFMDSLKLAAVVTHVADARTCVLHPASTTHRQLTDEQLADCGVTPDLIRFSVGIENYEDILADIINALEQC